MGVPEHAVLDGNRFQLIASDAPIPSPVTKLM
jgi:hypothetical protein